MSSWKEFTLPGLRITLMEEMMQLLIFSQIYYPVQRMHVFIKKLFLKRNLPRILQLSIIPGKSQDIL